MPAFPGGVRCPGCMDEADRPTDELDIAVRVFTTRTPPEHGTRPSRARRTVQRSYPSEALIFDTETATGPSQRLLIGVWRFYQERPGDEPGTFCVEEGIFHADNLPDVDPDGYDRLSAYVAERSDADTAAGYPSRLVLMSATDWLQKRFHRYGYQHRRRPNFNVVGFNLVFDLGRLARHWGAGRKHNRGAFSLGFWGSYDDSGKWHNLPYHPRLIVRAIDPRRTLFSWGTASDEESYPARFVDLHTLVFALTDENHSLESAGEAFGDDWEKDPIPYGVIDERSLDYARDDVRHTAILYRNCLAELRRHEGIDLDPARLYSPATVGSAYLEAMGVDHPLERFMADPAELADAAGPMVGHRLHPSLMGLAMSGFFGGRAEARIVRQEVPVTLVDASSMYPSVNANLRTWDLLTADRLEAVDATGRVQDLLVRPDLLDHLLRRETWADDIGVTLAEVESPIGQILPVRAWYDPHGTDPGIGINPFTYDGSLWYLLPDVLASVLLTGRAPTVARAIRLIGIGRQSGLRAVLLRGEQRIHPLVDDPFVRMIEERHRIDDDQDRPDAERKRLSRFLKITANATAYGILARFDRHELADRVALQVWGPDGTPLPKRTAEPEDAGPFTFPPIAATITAAARLLLAMLERMVTDAGGTYAFCDTDSMAIVRHSGRTAIRGLGAREIQAILARFETLNPYRADSRIPVWKPEHDSLDRPLRCVAISAKRYILTRPHSEPGDELIGVGDGHEEFGSAEGDGPGETTDWSEHGLGVYLSPLVDVRGRASRDAKGRRVWVEEAWRTVLADALGRQAPPSRAWAGLPAVSRFTISSPAIADWFRERDRALPIEERMHPGGFGLLAHPVEGDDSRRMPAAPYEPDPSRWLGLDWYDRRSRDPIELFVGDPVADPERFASALAAGEVWVNRYVDVIATYSQRAEHKSLSPSRAPVDGETAGLLQRRPLRSAPARTHLTGKEGNKLLERMTGIVTETDDYWSDYGTRAERWDALIVPALERMGTAEIVRRTNPTWRRSVERILEDGHRPKQVQRERTLTGVAVVFAREHVPSDGLDDLGVLAALLELPGVDRRCACGCGLPASGRSRWFSEAHRKRARRRGSSLALQERTSPPSRVSTKPIESDVPCGSIHRAVTPSRPRG